MCKVKNKDINHIHISVIFNLQPKKINTTLVSVKALPRGLS